MTAMTQTDSPAKASFPAIRTVGVDGFLVSFADGLDERANRAALAFRAALERESWPGVAECATSLVSAFFAVLIWRLATMTACGRG